MNARLAALATLLLALPAVRASDTSTLIRWLLDKDRALEGIPFTEVVEAATGKNIVPIDAESDALWMATLGLILDRTLDALNEPGHPIRSSGRINEASRFVEDRLIEEINRTPGWSASIPVTSAGSPQRSGYPDLRVKLPDGSVVYLDPKLYSTDSRRSSLRTFYYEPKTLTNKIQDDAHHLLIGVAHNGRSGTEFQLTGWELVDVSRIRVQLKAEFQASNADIYRDDTIVGKSSRLTGE